MFCNAFETVLELFLLGLFILIGLPLEMAHLEHCTIVVFHQRTGLDLKAEEEKGKMGQNIFSEVQSALRRFSESYFC